MYAGKGLGKAVYDGERSRGKHGQNTSERAIMTDAVYVIAVDHTGFAVSSLDEAVRFWTGALGFTLERQSEMGATSCIR